MGVNLCISLAWVPLPLSNIEWLDAAAAGAMAHACVHLSINQHLTHTALSTTHSQGHPPTH